jgi:hypothetical protein
MLLRNGSARDRPLPQVFQAEQHGQRPLNLSVEMHFVAAEPLQLVGVERLTECLLADEQCKPRNQQTAHFIWSTIVLEPLKHPYSRSGRYRTAFTVAPQRVSQSCLGPTSSATMMAWTIGSAKISVSVGSRHHFTGLPVDMLAALSVFLAWPKKKFRGSLSGRVRSYVRLALGETARSEP